jgi:hypothetical protein
MKRSRSIIVIYLLITCLKDHIWKSRGSEHILGAIAVFGFRKMDTRHMARGTIVADRRLSMCQQVNSTLEQLASGVIFYYQPVYPHHVDFRSGHTQYLTQIPPWWYAQAQLPQVQPIQFASMSYEGTIPESLFYRIAIYMANPSRLVLSCTSSRRSVQIMEVAIITEIQSQRFPIAQLLRWYGHQLWTEGDRAPIINRTVDRDDAAWLRGLYARWDDEENRALTMEQYARNDDLFAQGGYGFLEYEPPVPHPHEEEARWYDALNFFEQAVEEAYVFGERIPVGTRTLNSGIIQLIYSDEEDTLSRASDESL